MVEEVAKENIEVPIIGDEERVDELIDEELLNNNSARDEEDVLKLQNDELHINAAGKRVEEVTKADIAVVDKDLEYMLLMRLYSMMYTSQKLLTRSRM